MKIITQPTKLVYFSPDILNRLNRLLQPTVEVAAARDYQLSEFIAAGGQAVNAMDAYPGRFLTVPGSLIEDADSDFSAITGNWTLGAGVSITAGVLRFSGGGGDASIVLDLGVGTYQVMFILSNHNADTITPDAGGTSGTARSTNDTFIENIVGGGSTAFTFVNGGSFEGDIEIVTITLISAYRIDVITNRRGTYDFVVVDGHNMLDAYGGSLANQIGLFYNTVDNFSTATKVAGLKEISGRLGENVPAIDLDGVDDLGTVTDDASITDIFDGGGSVAMTVNLRSDGGNDTGYLLSKTNVSTAGYLLFVSQESGGKVKVQMTYFWSGTNLTWSTDDEVITLNQDSHVLLTYNADAPENVPILYIDGVAVALTVNAPTGTRGSDVGQDLIVGNRVDQARGTDGAIKENKYYNRILTAEEAVADFNGEQIDGGNEGNQTNLVQNGGFDSDTVWDKAGTAAIAAGVGTMTGDGTSGNSLGQTNLFTANSKDDQILQLTYEITANTLTGTPELRVGSAASAEIWANQTINTDIGVHSYFIEKKPDKGAGQNAIFFRLMAASTGGIISIDNVVITQVGAVASYTGAGLSESQGMWFDDTDNGNDMVLTGVQYDNTPTDNGFYFLEFEAVTNALFWYVEFNSGDVIALDDGQIGNITIGQKVDINRGFQPSFGGTYDRGLSARKTQSGRILAEQLFGEQPDWGISYTKITDKTKFDALLTMVNELKNSLYPLYVSFDYDAAVPTIQRVRIAGRVTWKCSLHEGDEGASWDLSYKLETDLN